MPFLLLLIGAIIAIAAFNNAQGTLATELEQDVPAFLKWGLAVTAVGAVGWIPGMQTISRWLLALVMVVLFLTNYQQIFAGFQSFAQNFGAGAAGTPTGTSATPATAYMTNPAQPQVTAQEISGTGSVSGTSSAQAVNVNAAAGGITTYTSPYGSFDPTNFLAAFESGFGGFGGIA